MLQNNPTIKLPAGSLWLGHWILFGAACNVAGWSLSAIHYLNAVGLIIAIPLFWFLMARLIGLGLPPKPSKSVLSCWHLRFKKLLPASFIILAILSLIGGFLYAPNNFDALIYRMPRVADWLMAEHWEWITTTKNNLNTRSTGFEWWTAPMFAILKTDRLVFLINLVSFLFLPGLFFSLFRQMGVPRKSAYSWMWILPSGYCFVLQAASVGNDMLATLFAVAAFDFGFRWKRGGGYPCFALALLGCAMMTAIKPTTLPLLLPFAVLFHDMWLPTLRKPLATLALAVLFAFASFLPTAAINFRQCGDWTGAAAEDQKLGQVQPLVGIATNTINTSLQNLIPPVFPLAGAWNKMFIRLFPASFLEATHRSFEEGGANFSVSDFQGEESSGVGTGLSILLFVSILMGLCKPAESVHQGSCVKRLRLQWLLMCGAFSLAILAYFSRAGMSTVARHIAPFYPFFFALCLCGRSQNRVVQSRTWRWATYLAVASALAMVIITPSRPLWPANTLFSKVNGNSPQLLQRAKTGYEVYSGRSDGLGPIRDALPPDITVVGYLSYSTSPELPLWKPYMHRQLRHLLPQNTLGSLRTEGIRYLALNTDHFELYKGTTPEEWVKRDGGIVKTRISLQLIARQPPCEWWVIEIPPLPL